MSVDSLQLLEEKSLDTKTEIFHLFRWNEVLPLNLLPVNPMEDPVDKSCEQSRGYNRRNQCDDVLLAHYAFCGVVDNVIFTSFKALATESSTVFSMAAAST